MKDRRGSSGGGDRFTVFPFSMGCMSQSAVSVADPSEKKPQNDPSSSSVSATTTAQTAGSEDGAGEMVKEKAAAAAATPQSPGLVAAGVSRLMKGIKSLSLMFAGDEEDEEEEREMVIGYPTDVQHVGHIGWDGHNKVGGGAMGMVNAFSLPSSLSLRQLEMAMDQAAHASA
ncbi:unnamed protein product [Urochloa humidicola]